MASAKTDLTLWKARLGSARHSRQTLGNSDDWTKFEQYYLGKYPGGGLSMNYTFALIRSVVPLIYFRNPRVSALPRKSEAVERAEMVENLDNWLIQEMNVKREMKRSIVDGYLCGVGVFKIGYDSQYGYAASNTVKAQVPLEDGKVADMSDETLTSVDEDLNRIEHHADINPGMPWVLRVHPNDILVDSAATCIEDAEWVAHRYYRRLRDVKADSKYTNTKNICASHDQDFASQSDRDRHTDELAGSSDGTQPTNADQAEAKSLEWVELWEIHHAPTKTVKVLCMGHDKFLVDQPDELQIDGLPFVAYSFNPHPTSFWGISDVRTLLPQQLELNEVRSLQQKFRRHAVKRLILQRGAFDDDDKTVEEKMMSEDAKMILWCSTDKSPDEVAKELQSFIPQDLGVWSESIRQDMREIAGMGRNQMGEYDKSSRRSATEAGIVQQNSQLRTDERRDVLADVLALIMRKVNQIIFKNWTVKRVMRIAGQEGGYTWKEYTGQDLAGEYDYRVEPDDALPYTRETRKTEALLLHQTLQGNPRINQDELLRHLLGSFESAEPGQLIMKLPAEMEMMMAAEAAQNQGGKPSGAGPRPGGA